MPALAILGLRHRQQPRLHAVHKTDHDGTDQRLGECQRHEGEHDDLGRRREGCTAQRQRTGDQGRRALQQRITREQLDTIRNAVFDVHASDNLLDYLQRLVAYTRQSPEFAVGLSPRGALALLDCARTWAVMHNRTHVVPEDVQVVLPAVAAHRLVPSSDYAGDGLALVALLQRNVDVILP